MSKIKTYLGLCVKSGSLIIGQDKLKIAKKHPCLLILSPSATENLKDLAIRLSIKFDCECLMLSVNLDELVPIKNCKIVGITNHELKKAITKCDNEYTILRSNNDK